MALSTAPSRVFFHRERNLRPIIGIPLWFCHSLFLTIGAIAFAVTAQSSSQSCESPKNTAAIGFQVCFNPLGGFEISQSYGLKSHHACVEHIGRVCLSNCINALKDALRDFDRFF